MPLHVKEFIIQAKFQDDKQNNNPRKPASDLAALKEDIINECMEKLEEHLRKRVRR